MDTMRDPMLIFINILMVLAFTAFMVSTLLALTSKPRETRPRLYTLLECLNCGYRETRGFRKGDYVGAEQGKCPKCGSKLVVTAVYEERPKRKERRVKL